MATPLLIVLPLLFGATSLTATTAACGATSCTSCTTQVHTTCPTTQTQCSPKAVCPAGFSVVENGNPNKCYLVGETDVGNFAAASVACATAGGSLFEPGTTAELHAVQAIIPTTAPPASYYIGYTDIGSKASPPTGIHTGNGLPANGAVPVFAPAANDCVAVPKSGPFVVVADCVGTARVLCEARLDKVNCVCP